MVTYTPILRLAKPLFDQTPWDEDINGDLNILDSAIGNFFGIANYIGLWRNNTAYVLGQVVTDAADSSLWTCSVSHTSAVSPTTFAADRAAHPTYWTQQIANAADLAQQAANSAAAAAASASAAAASAATISNAVPLAGGTMTGPLILSADPGAALGAATKQYVDARVGGTAFLPITGGGISGNLSVTGIFSVGGISLLGYQVRAYSAGQSPSIYGGRDGFGFAGMYLDGAGTIHFSTMDSNGVPTFHRGWFSPAGGFNAVQQVTSAYIWSSGQVAWGGGASALSSTASESVVGFSTDGWRLQFNRATGDLFYYNSASAWMFYCTSAGQLIARNMYAVGNLTSDTANLNWLTVNNNATVTGSLTVSSTSHLAGLVNANDIHTGGITAGNGYVTNVLTVGNYIDCTGNARVVGNIDANSCNITTIGGGNLRMNADVRAGNNIVAEVDGYKPGGGVWAALSDARMKTVGAPYTSGLNEILKLEPVHYHYNTNTQRQFIGLVAQQVEDIMPEMVKKVSGEIDGKHIDDMREMDATALMYACVNALKEVSARLTKLEQK